MLEEEYRHHYEPYPQLSHVWEKKKQFVCVCEDITHTDLAQGVAEGFDEVETLKRYSTFSMGPCQGRMCADCGPAYLCKTGRSCAGRGAYYYGPAAHYAGAARRSGRTQPSAGKTHAPASSPHLPWAQR